jgi:hypothetical protein
MTKDKVNIPIKGRLWGCSDALRKLKPYSEILEGHAEVAARAMKKSTMFTIKQEENYTLIQGPVFRYLEAYHTTFFKKVTEHYINQATELYKVHPDIKKELAQHSTNQDNFHNPAESATIQNRKVITQLECPF